MKIFSAKIKLVLCFLFGFILNSSQAATAGVKISDYPRATAMGDNDLFVLSYYSSGAYTTNKSISFTNVVTQLQGIITGTSSVYINGVLLANPNFASSANVTINSSSTNVTFGISSLTDVNISSSAGITRSKLAVGTANHVIIDDGVGNLSSEATLGAARFPALMGDVTTPGASLATTIANNAITTAKVLDANITLAKMANITTDSILGRSTASSGVPEVLTALPFAFTGDVTRPIDSNAQTLAASGVTAGVYGNAANIPQITVDAKGRITLVTTNTVSAGGTVGTIINTATTAIGDWLIATDTTKTNFQSYTGTIIDVNKPPYSADPTGVADSTTAINTAVAAMAGKALYLHGTYLVRPLNNPPANVLIYGDGKGLAKLVLKAPVAGDVLWNTTNSGITFRGIWFYGSNANFNVSSVPVAITGLVHQATGSGGVVDCQFEGFNVGMFSIGNGDTTARINAASYINNYATNNQTGLGSSSLGGNEGEYTTIGMNIIQRCYQGIYNYGAGNLLVIGNNIHDCTYPIRHGGSSTIAKGNSLYIGNFMNHGQVNVGAPGGGSGTLRFTGNMFQGSQVAFGFTDAASTVIKAVTMDNNDFSDYIFFNSSTTISNCFIENNTFGGTGNTPNRYNWTGPSQVRFWNNRNAITGLPVFEGAQNPYMRAVSGTATVSRFDDAVKATGTFTVNLPDATITTLQQADGAGVVQPWGFHLISISGIQTVTPAAGNINGAATLAVTGPIVKYIFTDGINWYAH